MSCQTKLKLLIRQMVDSCDNKSKATIATYSVMLRDRYMHPALGSMLLGQYSGRHITVSLLLPSPLLPPLLSIIESKVTLQVSSQLLPDVCTDAGDNSATIAMQHHSVELGHSEHFVYSANIEHRTYKCTAGGKRPASTTRSL